jgi:hypothetical protein
VKRKFTLRPVSFGVVFLCLDYCVAKIYECGIIKIERQPPTRWVADSMGQKIRLGEWQITEAVFLCAFYFLFLKMNVSNASINIPKIIRSWKV